jgi:hypothetical protein
VSARLLSVLAAGALAARALGLRTALPPLIVAGAIGASAENPLPSETPSRALPPCEGRRRIAN